MGGDTGRGADVYLETHGESVFKRLCHIMILVKEDETSIRYSPEDCQSSETWKYNFKPTTVERFELGKWIWRCLATIRTHRV